MNYGSIAPHAAKAAQRIGISRIADHPSRPDRRTRFPCCKASFAVVCVSQGKGLTPLAAYLSAIGEAAKSYFAEQPRSGLSWSSFQELGERSAINPALIPRPRRSTVGEQTRTFWIGARDVVTGDELHVPLEAVHTDYVLPNQSSPGFFHCSSNGLAAGYARNLRSGAHCSK